MISADDVTFSVAETTNAGHAQPSLFLRCEVAGSVFVYNKAATLLQASSKHPITDETVEIIGVFVAEIAARLQEQVDWKDVLWRFYRRHGTPSQENMCLLQKTVLKFLQRTGLILSDVLEYDNKIWHRVNDSMEIELYHGLRLEQQKIDLDLAIVDKYKYSGRARRDEISERALELFLATFPDLNPDQDIYWVDSPLYPGLRYEVHNGTTTFVGVYYNGVREADLCLVVGAHKYSEWYAKMPPNFDALVQKLMLFMYDEHAIWRVTNYYAHCNKVTLHWNKEYNKLEFRSKSFGRPGQLIGVVR